MPRTPKSTIRTRRLPKVGDEIMVRVKVTRVDADADSPSLTVMLPWNGQKSTGPAKYLLGDEDA